MRLEVIEGKEDSFEHSLQFAYKDGVIYDILESNETYMVGGCMGKMRVIVEDGSVLKWIYPLMSAGEYQIFSDSTIEEYKKIVSAYENKITKCSAA
jgi:hypothetical protein